jgi:hypothetical protein
MIRKQINNLSEKYHRSAIIRALISSVFGLILLRQSPIGACFAVTR